MPATIIQTFINILILTMLVNIIWYFPVLVWAHQYDQKLVVDEVSQGTVNGTEFPVYIWVDESGGVQLTPTRPAPGIDYTTSVVSATDVSAQSIFEQAMDSQKEEPDQLALVAGEPQTGLSTGVSKSELLTREEAVKRESSPSCRWLVSRVFELTAIIERRDSRNKSSFCKELASRVNELKTNRCAVAGTAYGRIC
ncbi:hypothetical protein [Pleionea sp. CnH1-48]|uniref:hypothetical protein n=1 Tax=Pleionea sp. CnH1-48 TaxID=2954494 RepID=UPI0020974DA0|nr:hypothetical protein [Pleionea sp. CnH1-48]MCO7225327.1 hypothetical protein [Pleionea sp. CnH1-48]